MQFLIQPSNPQPSQSVSPDDETLGEAIETIFPLQTEVALLGWNDVYVPLTYKYDISLMIDDIIAMLTTVAAQDEGAMTIHWPSNTFRARWVVAWSKAELTIKATWESTLGGTEDLLNQVPTLAINRSQFLAEWNSLLAKIKESVYQASNGVNVNSLVAGLDSLLCQPSDHQYSRAI